MRPLHLLLVLVACVGCKRKAPPVITPVEQAPPSDAARAEVLGDAPSEVFDAAPAPKPAPTPPAIACVTDPRVRFRVTAAEKNELTEPSAGAAGLECSPFKTGSSPLELTAPPGTILRFAVDIQVSEDAGVFEAPSDPPTYTTAGLPKGAWIDPAEQAFKWRVAGAEGEVFAFTIAAHATLPEGKRCVTTSLVVRVKDDDATRRAQAQWINRDECVAHAAAIALRTNDTAEIERYDRLLKCGGVPIVPVFRDADGDGLLDALFQYPFVGDGSPNETDVFLRRGDTFAKVGRGTGVVEHAADGTTFLVDTASAGTGYSCSIGIKIFQVYKNRIGVVIDEPTRAPLPDGGCHAGDGFTVDRAADAMIGFTDRATDDKGVTTKRTWRWNGKRFALVP